MFQYVGAAGRFLLRQLDRRVFRIRPAEPFVIRLGQRRIFVLPTRAGLAFGATLFAMLLASINYTLSLGYALTFFLTGIGTASMFHAFRNLLRLEIRGGAAPPVHCGEAAHFELMLSNADNRPRHSIRVFNDESSVALDIAPESTACARLTRRTPRRGWLAAGRITVETLYPLGLIRAWSVFTPAQPVLVYPALEVHAPSPARVGDGRDAAGSDGGEDEFAGLREHHASDSPRRVAWKAVARTGTLVSKHFAGGSGAPQIFDWHAMPPGLDTETRLQRLARWVTDAAHQNHRYTLVLPGQTHGPGHDDRHLHQCLQALALYDEKTGDGQA